MNEEKRVDVKSIKDLEKRVDVLEGQPETPLVCPIFKTNLDNLNDRITVLEGETPSEIKNPMRFSEIDGFEERVEALEEGPTIENPIVFKKGTKVKFNTDFFSVVDKYLTDVQKDLQAPIDGAGINVANIILLGPDTEVYIDSGVAISGDNFLCLSTPPSSVTGKDVLINESTDFFEGWTKIGEAACIKATYGTILADYYFDKNITYTLKRDIILTNPGVVALIVKDAKEPEIITLSNVDANIFPIIPEDEPEPPTPPTPPEPTVDTVSYSAGDLLTLNPNFLGNVVPLISNPPASWEVPEAQESGADYPFMIFLGPDTEYVPSECDNDYLIEGNNALGIGLNQETGTIWLFEKDEYNQLYSHAMIGSINDYDYNYHRSIPNLCAATFTSFENDSGLEANVDLFNPVKLLLINSTSGYWQQTEYAEINLPEKMQPFTKLD